MVMRASPEEYFRTEPLQVHQPQLIMLNNGDHPGMESWPYVIMAAVLITFVIIAMRSRKNEG